MNPATFLRVLGPEPWNVAYAEPSIRPDDSRYGDNPNRLQRHTQYQVGSAAPLRLEHPARVPCCCAGDSNRHPAVFSTSRWLSRAWYEWMESSPANPQVILKPDPGNSQELFLGSLEALGIDTHKHDVRFVEDNWESPALGAWGLGWEVWLDGMEVTQFTYFQQAGGRALEAPAVEITYGLERIVMALQGVTDFKDIQYNHAVK